MKTSYLVLSAFFMALLFTSCEKSEIESAQISTLDNAIESDSTEIKLKLEDLSPAAQKFLSEKYKGFSFVEATKKVKSGVIIYEVKIKVDGKMYNQLFDFEGKPYIEVKNNIKLIILKEAELLETTKAYLKTKYPNYVFVKAEKSTIGTTTFYNVKIKVGEKHENIRFDSNGNVINPPKVINKDSVILASALPTAITTFIKEKYVGYTIKSAAINTVGIENSTKLTTFKVKITNGVKDIELKFDTNGKVLNYNVLENSNSETSITQANLLPAIKTYLETNHKGYVFLNATKSVKNNVIKYQVKIKSNNTPTELNFDEKGNFVSVVKPEVKPTSSEIKFANLSSGIKTYLFAKYPGYVFVSANSKNNDSKDQYTLVVIKYKQVNYELKFNSKNELIIANSNNKETKESVKLEALPTEIQTYLKTNFAKAEQLSAIKITKNNVSTYEVKFKFDKKTYSIVFDTKGKVLSQKKA